MHVHLVIYFNFKVSIKTHMVEPNCNGGSIKCVKFVFEMTRVTLYSVFIIDSNTVI